MTHKRKRISKNSINPLLTIAAIIIVTAIYSQCSENAIGQQSPTSVTQNAPSVTNESPSAPQSSSPVKKETSPARQGTPTISGIEIPASAKGTEEQILTRYAYTASYNKATRNPNWVAWRLTASHTNGEFNRNGIKFAEDEDVAAPRATNLDYTRSGYDRGHMCPSGDNKWSERAQRESFFYTNCCPQLHSLNDGDWNELESRCRRWAKTYGEIYIACGPMYTTKSRKTIGKNKVAVPDSFFKVVLRLGTTPAAIAFTFRNSSESQPLDLNVHTVDEIEKLTGIDFFPQLDNKTENKIEAQADLSQWK